MKKSKEETAETRKRILKSASRAFRAGGFAGVSVKDLMQEAGLTHGAFYAHFPSKEALMGEACLTAFDETAARFERMAALTPGHELQTILKAYISQAHVDNPGTGCAVPMLAGEAARGPDEVKDCFTKGIVKLLGLLAQHVPDGDEATRQAKAMSVLSEAVGGILLSRAVSDATLREQILAACRQDLLET